MKKCIIYSKSIHNGVLNLKLKVGLLNDSFPPIIDGVAAATKAYADNIHNKLGEAKRALKVAARL